MGILYDMGWVCCWFSSPLREFSARFSGSPLSTKTNISKFQFNLKTVDIEEPLCGFATENSHNIYFIIFLTEAGVIKENKSLPLITQVYSSMYMYSLLILPSREWTVYMYAITPFSSPEAAILLVSTKDRDLWPEPIFLSMRKVLILHFLPIRFDNESVNRRPPVFKPIRFARFDNESVNHGPPVFKPIRFARFDNKSVNRGPQVFKPIRFARFDSESMNRGPPVLKPIRFARFDSKSMNCGPPVFKPIRFARFDESVNHGPPVLEPARGLDPWCWPKGLWLLGTRMAITQYTCTK